MPEQTLKKQQMEYIGIGVLVLVAFFIGISRFQKKEKDDEVFSRSGFNERWKETEDLESKVPEEKKGIKYSSDFERAPFKSPFDDKEKEEMVGAGDIVLPEMTLQGMLWNSVRPQAIIDNKVYEIGDTIILTQTGEDKYEVKIKDITKGGIYLKYKGKEFIVRPK